MPVEYERQYTNMTKHYSRYHGYAYDGVWAAALAIEEVGRKAHAYNLSLADFSYRYLLLHDGIRVHVSESKLWLHKIRIQEYESAMPNVLKVNSENKM